MDGCFIVSLFAILLSKDKSKEGNNNKLDNIANNKVADTKAPNATVPPKFDSVNTENPKNKTMEEWV